MGASRTLVNRIKSDAEAPDFWYVPKGKSVDAENWKLIAEQLAVLNKFKTVDWSDAQPLYVKELLKKKLIDPYKDHENDFSAVARMQLPVWRLLGLAWVNSKNVPEVTEVGERFIKSTDDASRRKLLTMQLHRYQFYNPSNDHHFSTFRTFPIVGLYRMLLDLGGRMNWPEFLIFGTRARTFQDAEELVDLVEEWRSLAEVEQEALFGLAKTIPSLSHTKSEDGTTMGKVDRASNYIKALLRISPYLECSKEHVAIPAEQKRAVRRIVREAYKTAEFVDYASEQDWLAQYGQTPVEARWGSPWTTASDARSYYERIGLIDAATEAFAKEIGSKSSKAIDKYKRVQIRERVLEDLLEADLESLEKGLKLIGRQYATASGPIDLLAKDANDLLVVIELKRGRTSDKVVAQIGRYLTWVTDRLAKGKSERVRGIVVGAEFDHTFALAIRRHRDVKTYTFDLLISYDPWEPKTASEKPSGRRKKR